MLDVSCCKTLLLISCLVAQYEALFSSRASSKIHHIRVVLEDDERLIVSKHATVKLLHPIRGDKFYPVMVPKSNKKQAPPKYVKQHTAVVGKLMSSLKVDAEKNCCGEIQDEWKEKEVSLEELFRPVSLSVPAPDFNSGSVTTQIHGGPQFVDIKPVREHIENDLKYDFRTKTHFV